jgi:hypothetical protein
LIFSQVPHLQERCNDLTISIIMGILWSLWCLPLVLDPASSMFELAWVGEILFSLSLTVMYIWLYDNTRRSLLLVSVFHALSNTVAYGLLEMDVFLSFYPFVVGVTTVFALLIILIYGAARFSGQGVSHT